MKSRNQFKVFAVVIMLALASCSHQPTSVAADTEAAQKLFAVEIKVGPSWDSSIPANEQNFFAEHSANLKHLRQAGHIVLGARYSDIGLIIFSAKSAEEVGTLMSQDPSMTAGTFKYEVHPMNVFYPGLVQP